ncbi:class I SAM-dependent DNA methyltransferase [Neptunicoccus cionae]|uniref:SAM-dependent methyltransferase n=1 Tax=Neptunicoccus cionae TaxID=2035344 RepID=A0A916VNX6_9RHOB|nr:methyltransferase domain-containing protein [Amylibacter cionae]GGA13509.1 SAM-dependent methyltransferase [Amylibacter cionae]
MSQKRTPTELLEGAYKIETPQDSVEYYQDFADHYDAEFAQKLGYVYPRIIADHYRKAATPFDRPVADIGCGTGLVAEAINLPRAEIEGFDISPEMLERARQKGLYGGLHRVDLTQPLIPPQTLFGAVVSAGAFTHGHLGPEPLENLLALAQTDALFCIGVNAQHYRDKGFAAVLARLRKQGRISAPKLKNVPIYSDPDSAHGADTAQVLLYRKR